MPTRDEKNDFSVMIQDAALNEGIPCMEAIIDYCNRSGLEVEVAASLVNSVLKAKLEEEARALRFLAKSSALPI